jgi:hypothetical protein
MHVILWRTVHLGTLSAHCRLDLHLRCCQRWQNNKKWQKHGMGSWYVMYRHKVYKVWHTKVLGHGCFTTKCHQKHVVETCMPYYLTQMDRWGQFQQEAYETFKSWILTDHEASCHEQMIQWLPLGDRVCSNNHNRVLGFRDALRGFAGVLRQSTGCSKVWRAFKWA